MNRNMGMLDRGLRVLVVAPVAIVAGLLLGAGSVEGVALLVFAGIMLVTSAVAHCPTYTLVGISTYPRGLHRVHRLRGGHA